MMVLSGFELGDVLAQSGRTVVRRAVRRNDGVPVVTKALAKDHPTRSEIEQLEFEYGLLRRLDCLPHLVRAHSIERDRGRPVLVLEDCGGEPLSACIAGGALPLERFFPVAMAVTQGLGGLHERGVVHRDIKPSNIVVNWSTGDVKVIDMDAALDLGTGRARAPMPDGVSPYMSPEQTGRINRELDYRTDYYSLGVTFFELLTGTLPFQATDTMGWVHGHISRVAPEVTSINPAVPEALGRIVRKLLSKNPEDRYQSAHGLLFDLERARDQARNGGDAGFPLATRDLSSRFQVSSKFYGREAQLVELLQAFHAAARGASETVLVTGDPGSGKTALLRELEPRVLAERGRVLRGRLAQADGMVPYAAIVQLLRALTKQLLSESDARLAAWRRRLNEAIAPSGRVLLDLVPELEAVLGPQPELPTIKPDEARARFRRAVLGFVAAVPEAQAPLVILLDNLQWADPSTVELLSALASGEARHLLLVAAHRAAEPQSELSAAFRGAHAVRTIELGPLTEGQLLDLLADTTRAEPARCAPLAAAIHGKTGGNPLFLHELLKALAEDGAFTVNAEEGRWEWDHDAVDGAAVSANVVDLIAARLQRLRAQTVEVLGRAACIGETFDAATVAALVGLSLAAVVEALAEAVAAGIVSHGDEGGEGGYRFQHARLQQATYAKLEESQRCRVHLELGRLLLARDATADDAIFEVTGHLNRGRALLTEPAEALRLAELNVTAGLRAKQATAYAIAVRHLAIALEVRPRGVAEASVDAQWWFETGHAHATCVFLSGDTAGARALALSLVAGAPDRIAAARAHFLAACALDYDARYAEEIEVIREALGCVGIRLPKDVAEIQAHVGQGIGRMQAYLGQHPVEELLRLPPMTDGEKIVAMDLLFQLIPPAIQTYPPLFVLAELTMFELATSSGVTVASAKNFMDCAIIQGGVLGDHATARRLAEVAFELIKRYAPAPLEAGVNFVFANFVSHWRAPYRESLEAFQRAKKIGRELGNVGHTAYAYALETQRLFAVGQELDTCAAAVREACSYLRQNNARGTLPAALLVANAIARLRGEVVDDEAPPEAEAAFDARIRATGNGPFMFAHGQNQMLCSYLLGDKEGAALWDAQATALLPGAVSIYPVVDYHLLHGLVLCQRWAALPTGERDAAGASLEQSLAKLAQWAELCPANFAHKHHLLVAEVGRVRGAGLEDILAAYDQALAAAGDDFPHMRALINERQALLWLERGRLPLARALMHEAHYLYGLWGARVKVRQLEAAYPEWFSAPAAERVGASSSASPGAVSPGALDLASVMKATRAISGEVSPERLYARLMDTILENAGAQRGCLLVVSEAGCIEVVARAVAEGERPPASGAVALEDAGELCVEMVRFVARTGEVVVLDDASADPAYGKDPWLQRSHARSVMCLPVLHQGRVLAILYVENSAVTHAFAADRQQLLQLIASQAAVSITNARLYDSLEQKVAARTSELAARNVDLERAHEALTSEMKTRQLVEVELRQAQKLEAVGRLASGVAHEINTPVQFVTDSVQFLKDACTDVLSLVEKLREVRRQVEAGEPAAGAAAEAASMEDGIDLAYLAENVPPAFERSLEGLERVASIVRSMKEFAHPDATQMVSVDLNRAIDSTLTMARSEYKYVADVHTDFGELPMILCHAGEINQAILNIVVNAAHAIGDVVKGSDARGRIGVRTRRDGERVVIEIEDTGGGIPDAIRDRIFDPFFTTKEVGKGTGQGLAIARSVVVDKHGGELKCRSEVGKGTTFSIALPIEGRREGAAKTA